MSGVLAMSGVDTGTMSGTPPSRHTSVIVQPTAGTQADTWQLSGAAGQVRCVAPGTQAPAWHVSANEHWLPELHGVPSGDITSLTQTPVSQWPAAMHTSLHGVPSARPEHAPTVAHARPPAADKNKSATTQVLISAPPD
jgi:hypothetical protein